MVVVVGGELKYIYRDGCYKKMVASDKIREQQHENRSITTSGKERGIDGMMKPSRQKWNDATMWRPQKHNIKRTLAWIAKNKSFGQTKQGGKNCRFFFVFGWWPIKGLSGVRLDRWPVPKIPITCGLNPWRPSSPCAVFADTISRFCQWALLLLQW